MANAALSLDEKSKLLSKMAEDFLTYLELGAEFCPNTQIFKIPISEKNVEEVPVSVRLAALKSLIEYSGLKKLAFDTRRINQELERNPRTNLQYWNRSDAFIEEEDKNKLKTFARLMRIMEGIKREYGAQPEWFESYARVLHDNVYRILRIKQADLDVFKPQLSYLEQLIFARYRLSMENLEKYSEEDIRAKVLGRDEELLKRGEYMKETGFITDGANKNAASSPIVIDGNGRSTQESIINAIFGAGGVRKEGEKTVERTITITIRDNVLE